MKLRIDEIDDTTSPNDIRGLLAKFGKVTEVTVNSGQSCMYALADMNQRDAEKAVRNLDGVHWRGQPISVNFAHRVYGKGWILGHDWKRPKLQ